MGTNVITITIVTLVIFSIAFGSLGIIFILKVEGGSF